MSISPEAIVVRTATRCAVCAGGDLAVALDLPALPLTGIYCREAPAQPIPSPDQRLLLCAACGHGQLAWQVAPRVLYGESYSFRTSVSSTARQGTSFFLSALEEMASGQRFRCALDLGCNDLYLLEQLAGRAERRVGIDPLWAGREDQGDDPSIAVVGAAVEDVDLATALPAPPDLVVCRHTVEHIAEPRAVLRQLLDAAADDALFLFEVPGFEALVRRLRFDQVFHQHLQYFSLASFRRLLAEVGAAYAGHWENYHDWGALLVAFRKRGGPPDGAEQPPFDLAAVRARYAIFRRQLATANDVLRALDGRLVYGYGAAQMLPVLAYHLGNDLAALAAVLDDDPAKDGLRWANLPVAIRHAGGVADLESASVLLTAVDNAKPILTKLLARRPRHIVYPLHVI